MLYVHVLPGPTWVDDAAFEAVSRIAEDAFAELRSALPDLPTKMYLLVHQTSQVIPETGDGGFTLGPQCIRWDVDPKGGVAAVARASLRRTLFHESYHCVRLLHRPQEAALSDWLTTCVFEGTASVFERKAGIPTTWSEYDPEVMPDWTSELLARPMGDDAHEWRFLHPDGRRNIAYRVGSWLVDQAISRSGCSVEDLVAVSPEEILALANL